MAVLIMLDGEARKVLRSLVFRRIDELECGTPVDNDHELEQLHKVYADLQKKASGEK